jgi:hypothetical protein
MAQVSDSDNDKFKAIKQIIENCSDITTDKLHPADLQFLFLKIYAVSDTPNINVTYNIAAEDCGSTEDDKYIQISFYRIFHISFMNSNSFNFFIFQNSLLRIKY